MNRNKIFQNNVSAILLALFCCFLWGSAFPCIKLGYKWLNIASDDVASQILFAGIRFTIAGIMVIIAGSVIFGKFLYPKKSDIPVVAIISFFQTIFQYVLFYIGLSHASGVNSSIIEGTNVFISFIFSSLVFRQEKMRIYKWIGCILGFAGVAVMAVFSGNGSQEHFSFMGEGFVFLSTVGAAMAAVLIKKFGTKHDPVMISGWQFILGGIIMAAGAAIFGGRISTVSPKIIILVLYMAFISAAAYTIWSMLLKYNSVSKMGVIGLSNPVFGCILSAIILEEYGRIMNIGIILSLALICFGIIVINKNPQKANNK